MGGSGHLDTPSLHACRLARVLVSRPTHHLRNDAHARRWRRPRPRNSAIPASVSNREEGSGTALILIVPLDNVSMRTSFPRASDRLFPAAPPVNDTVNGPEAAVGETLKNTFPNPTVTPEPRVADPLAARSEAMTDGLVWVSICGPNSEFPLKM